MFIPATYYATNDAESRKYIASRRIDTDALMGQITTLPYATVKQIGNDFYVNGTYCATFMCVLAYILKTFW